MLDNSNLQAVPDLLARDITKVSQFSLLGASLSEFAQGSEADVHPECT